MRKAVFFDRDGVINRYPGHRKYVTSLKRFRFLPRAKLAIAKLSRAGFCLFVASNQAGVRKGIYSQRTLDKITAKMLGEIERARGRITAVYYCIHRKEEGCACRKPKTGMMDIARRDFSVSLRGSYFVGDSLVDIETARAAGCTSILVLSGREKIKEKESWHIRPHFICKDLFEAAQLILKREKR